MLPNPGDPAGVDETAENIEPGVDEEPKAGGGGICGRVPSDLDFPIFSAI
jgi:hypothetical protein